MKQKYTIIFSNRYFMVINQYFLHSEFIKITTKYFTKCPGGKIFKESKELRCLNQV